MLEPEVIAVFEGYRPKQAIADSVVPEWSSFVDRIRTFFQATIDKLK